VPSGLVLANGNDSVTDKETNRGQDEGNRAQAAADRSDARVTGNEVELVAAGHAID